MAERRPPLWASIVCLGLPGLFVLAPLMVFVTLSFRSVENGEVKDTFGFENYLAFAADGNLVHVYLRTVLICLAASAANVCLGWLVALFISRRSARLRFFLVMLLTLPVFASYIIKVYAARGILGGKGVLNEALLHLGLVSEPITALVFNYNAIFIVFVIIYLPFAVIPIYLSMERIPGNLGLASADLGGSPWHEVIHLVLPLSMPGIVIASMFSFLMTFGDFVTPQLVGGVDGFMFGRVVFTQFGLSLNWPYGAALAVILLATTALVVGAIGSLFARAKVTL